jgi:hypothetical protein
MRISKFPTEQRDDSGLANRMPLGDFAREKRANEFEPW